MKPLIVRSYNQHMGGVDHVDQQLHGIHMLQKHYKWYKKLTFHLLSQCMLNSCKIHEKKTRQKKTFVDFMHDTIIQLIILKHEAPFPRELVVDNRVSKLSGRHCHHLKCHNVVWLTHDHQRLVGFVRLRESIQTKAVT